MNPPDQSDISDVLATQLLRQTAARPVDYLLKRLEQPDVGPWVEHMLSTPPLDAIHAAFPSQKRTANRPSAPVPLDVFVRVKEAAKTLVQHPHRADDRLRGLFTYYLSIAGALRAHKTFISAQPRTQINEALADIATLMPEPWPHWLGAAAMEEDDTPTR